MNFKHTVSLVSFIFGSLIFYFLFGLPCVFIYLFIWFDKVVMGYTRIFHVFGLGMTSTAAIFSGIIYGPLFAFLFAFLVMPLIDTLKWIVAPPYEPMWPPAVPSPEGFIDGLAGVAAAHLFGVLPLAVLIFVCVGLKIPLNMLKDMLMYGMPPKPLYVLDIGFTFVMVSAFSFIITL